MDLRFLKVDPVFFARIERDTELARAVIEAEPTVLEELGIAPSDLAHAPPSALRPPKGRWVRKVRARLRRESLDPAEGLSFYESCEGQTHELPLSAAFAPQASQLVRALGADGRIALKSHARRLRDGVALRSEWSAVFLSSVRAGRLAQRQPDLGEAVLSLARRARDEGGFLLVAEQ